MSTGPIPSQLCGLSDLASRPIGEKVRFLGCVSAYSTATATLTLEHDFPRGCLVSADVDVSLHLETLQSEQTQVGQWLNIIGYITTKSPKGADSSMPGLKGHLVGIQAIVLWSAGPLDVERYETIRVLESRQGRGLPGTRT